MRIKIRDDKLRDYFFLKVKESNGETFKEIGKSLNISKATFERYRNGKFLLPENLFLIFLEKLNEEDKFKMGRNIERLPDNYGQVLGGQRAYLLNFKEFDKGRKKGMLKLIKKRKAVNYDFSDFNLIPPLCEVIGAFIGDGFFNCYKNKSYHMEFSGDSRYDLNYYQNVIIPTIKEFFPNVNPKIYKVKKRNSIRIIFYSKEIFTFWKDFLGFKPGVKTYTVKIPQVIIESGGEYMRATIRGIFDTDGCVFFDRRKSYANPYPRINLHIANKELSEQIISFLSQDFKLYHAYDEKRQIYKIEIYGKEQLKKWISLIGFSNQRHLKRIAPMAQW